MSKKPVPSKKQAVSSTRSRYKTYVRKQRERLKKLVMLDTCPDSGEVKRRHFVAPESGKYRGKQIIKKQSNNSNKKLIQEIAA
jgi:ribosomal protein L32